MQVNCIHYSGLLSSFLSCDLHSMERILNCYFINHYYNNNKIVMQIASYYIDNDTSGRGRSKFSRGSV